MDETKAEVRKVVNKILDTLRDEIKLNIKDSDLFTGYKSAVHDGIRIGLENAIIKIYSIMGNLDRTG